MKKPISIPKLKFKALKLYSELVKLKAANEKKLYCYTCGKPLQLNSSDTHLGHYLSRGAYPGLTFRPDNSRVQCYRCNVHLHGNIIEFREKLINEIGFGAVTQLEAFRHFQVKWSRSDFHTMIDNFSKEIKEINQ